MHLVLVHAPRGGERIFSFSQRLKRAPRHAAALSPPRWVAYASAPTRARLRLFCFPHAGSGVAAYRTWARDLPDIQLALVQLPGREARLAEPPVTGMDDLVARLVPALRPHLDVDFAFFGHSMGAHVAFETTRALAAEGIEPRHLVVSGNRGPSLPFPRPPVHHLPDDAIVAEFARMGGTAREILADPGLMAILLPILRADLELCETYAYRPAPPLSCPITAWGGARDPDVPPSALAAWARETRGPFQTRLFDGGHFFLQGSRKAALDELARILLAAET